MEVDLPVGGGGGHCKRNDPYEFDEDGNAPSMEGFKRAPGGQPIKVTPRLRAGGGLSLSLRDLSSVAELVVESLIGPESTLNRGSKIC